MQEEPEDIDIKTYAKGLAGIVTLVFWFACVVIGYFIAAEKTGIAITLLLTLGFFLPIAAWAVVCLIQEKHLGTEIDTESIQTPAFYGFIFLLVYGLTMFVMFVLPEIYNQL
jgi:hypothetical protein